MNLRPLRVLLAAALALQTLPAAAAAPVAPEFHGATGYVARGPVAAFQRWASGYKTADRVLGAPLPVLRLGFLPKTTPGGAAVVASAAAAVQDLPESGIRVGRFASAKTIARSINRLAAAQERSYGELKAYGRLVSSLVAEKRFLETRPGELAEVADELAAAARVYDDDALLAASQSARAEALRLAALDSAARTAAALGATPDEEYALAAHYARLGKRVPALARARAAAAAGHAEAAASLAKLETWSDHLDPRRAEDGGPTLASAPAPRGRLLVSGLLTAALGAEIVSRFLGHDIGLFSLNSRLVIGALGVTWAAYERSASGEKWSWRSGFTNGQMILVSAARVMAPIMLFGIALQVFKGQHDPVPGTVHAVFGAGAAGYVKAIFEMPLAAAFEEALLRLGPFVMLLEGAKRLLKKSPAAAFHIAAIASAAVFGLLHQQYDVPFMIGTGLVGYFLAFGYYRSRWLWVGIAGHTWMNVMAITVRMLLGGRGLW